MERPAESSPAVGIFGPYQYLPLLSDFGSAIHDRRICREIRAPSIADYLQYFGPATKHITITNTAGDTIPATSTSLGSDAIRFDWQAFATAMSSSSLAAKHG